ncbi:MAG: hypothetical protein LBS18_04715 [Clostridiales bacterium]|jgi:hypothetical protein|nr:hypothetical protein [Clostridiales bacterium]
MDMTGRQKEPITYQTVTRAYSPTRGSAAVAYEQTIRAPLPQEYTGRQREKNAPQPKKKPAAAAGPRAKKALGTGVRITLVVCMLAVTLGGAAVIYRYYEINRQYAAVNELGNKIKSSETKIDELNVLLECAVTIQDAQAAAERFHMTYPSATQMVRVGDALFVPETGDIQDGPETLDGPETSDESETLDGPETAD